MADALANLATSLALSEGEKANVLLCNRWVLSYTGEYARDTNAISISIVEDKDWRQPLIDYLEHGKLTEDPCHGLYTTRAHYIGGLLTVYSYDVLARTKVIKPWKKLIRECVVPISLALNCIIG